MDPGAAGLKEQPFPTHGKPLSVVNYASSIAAIEMLNDTCEHPTGISLLQGPGLSGKSTLIRSFVESLDENFSVAVIDGRGLDTTHLLMSVLKQFGYELEHSSVNELLGLVRVFAMQQTVSRTAPLLIIKNTHELDPSALRALNQLAELRVRASSALKIVLVGNRSLRPIINAHAMASIAKRVIRDFHLRPMNREETKQFLYCKLRAAGSDYPEFIFSDEVCEDIWRASAGWPGIVDRVALKALTQADTLPVTVTDIEHLTLPAGTWTDDGRQDVVPDEIVPSGPPRLIVTNNGSVMNDLSMEKPRVMIGRAEHNDISIHSRFISRHHALFVRHGNATFIMDLNSTNGTFVNSKRVSNMVLIHEDVITIGHHRVKFYDPCATSRDELGSAEFADTMIMKTLEDMRNLRTQENTALLPAATENLPTILT